MIRRSLVVAAILLATSPALAAGPDQAVEDAAKARYAEGVKLYNKKKYEEARAAFMQANALKRRPASTMMQAESALKTGRWLEAAKGFDQFIADADTIAPRVKELVESGRKEARSHLARVRFDVPDGAEVVVDGEKLASLAPIDVMAGTHSVVVTHRDEKKSLEIETVAGKTTDVHPSFVPTAIIPATDTRSRPTPPPPTTRTTSTTTGEPQDTSILAPPSTTWPVYAMGAIGVAGLATAAIFGGLAANARHGVDVANETIARNAKPGADCAKADSFLDAAKGQSIADFQETCSTLARNKHFATAHQGVFQTSLVVGLAGFAGAITWFLVAPKEGAPADEKPAEKTTFIPWIGPTGAGGVFEGRF